MSNMIHQGDNLAILRAMAPASVHLAYLDPPFNTGRDFAFKPRDGGAEEHAYSDKWPSLDAFVAALRERCVAIRDIVTDDGCMVLHCDPATSHYVKVMLDGVFGRERFAGQVIWKRSAPNRVKAQIGEGHDAILFYQRGSVWRFTAPTKKRDDAAAAKYSLVADDGRRYQLTSLLAANENAASRPNLTYEFLGLTRTWCWTQERMLAAHAAGEVVQGKPGAMPRFKRYMGESDDVPIGDVWTDVPPINSQAHERTGYPTQKPEALLDRIVTACSHEGDTVLDPYCGSGTTLAVAKRLGRKWVGIDASPVAVRVASKRLGVAAQGSLFGSAA